MLGGGGGGGGEVGGEGEVLIGRSPLVHSKRRLFEATPSAHQHTDVSLLLAVCVSVCQCVYVCVFVCVCVREREGERECVRVCASARE